MENMVFGNSENLKFIDGLISTNKLAHAYLIVGHQGSGKKTMCTYIATRLSDDLMKSDPSLLRRIMDEKCPDIKVIRREEGKKSMGVDIVRRTIEDTSMTPFELNFKMYIFEEADTMTVQAQNSLLKIIEEPPANVYFMLLTSNPSSLIPTVRSRVQTIKMQIFSSEEINAYMTENKLFGIASDNQKAFAVNFSEGAIGKAKRLLSDGDKDYKAYSCAKKMIDIQCRKGVGGTLLGILKEAKGFVGTGDKRGQLNLLLTYLFMAYRELLNLKISDNYTSVFFDQSESDTYISQITADSIQKSVNVITELQKDSVFNYNITAAYNVLSIGLWEAV